MKKTNKINKDLLCAELFWEGGLDKLSLIQIIFEDYYADANVSSTYSIYQRFKNNILMSDGKLKYSKSFSEMLEQYYNTLIRETDISKIKKELYSFMETQQVWSLDYRGSFQEHLEFLSDEFLESNQYPFSWKVDDLTIGIEI